MSKTSLTAEQHRFIEDIASLLAPWGMPQTAGRMYGYMLLSGQAVGLDEIAEDLEISKSSASVAARLLERHAILRRQGERGSKRVLYEATDYYAGFLGQQSFLLGEIGALLQSRAGLVSAGAASKRLKEMSKFYLTLRKSMEAAIETFGGGAARGRRPPPRR